MNKGYFLEQHPREAKHLFHLFPPLLFVGHIDETSKLVFIVSREHLMLTWLHKFSKYLDGHFVS